MTNMFKVYINTDNAAFDTEENPDGERLEVARILRDIANKLENGKEDGVAHDVNGNRVGEWSF